MFVNNYFFQRHTRKLWYFVPVLLVLCTLKASAQTGSEAAGSNTVREGDWAVTCQDPQDKSSCFMFQELSVVQQDKDGNDANRRAVRIVVIHTKNGDKDRQPFLSVRVPLGVDLRPGAVFKVDDLEEKNTQYLRCLTDGCDFSYVMTDTLIKSMKAGNIFSIGIRPWGVENVMVFESSLRGFSKAYSLIQ